MFDDANPYFKQVRLLIRVLPIIQAIPEFVLTGGTAINLFYQNLPRLSVDIDLNYLPISERDMALADTRDKLKQIANEIERLKIANTEVDETKRKIFVRSDGAQVKIEVSEMRGSVLPVEQRNVVDAVVNQSLGFATMQLLSKNEIYAGKIRAALDRQHPRDLFDVKILMDEDGISKELIDVFLVYLLCSSSRPIVEFIDPNLKALKEVFEKQFVGMTETDISLASLEQTRDKLIHIVQSSLTDNDKEFLINFKKGEADWSSFVYPEAQHLPMVKWKQLNLEKMKKEDRLKAIDKLETVLNKC